MALWGGCGTWGGVGPPGEQEQCSHWREFGGSGDRRYVRAMSGEGLCAFLWGGTRAVELLCRCWMGARGRGRCTDGYLSIRKCPALQHGWDVSAAVPVSWSPGSLGGPSDRKSQSTPDPPETHSSLTLVPAQRVCTCVREAGQA